MGILLPRVQFSTILSTIFTIFVPQFWFIYSFPEPPIEEKSSLERSIEESLQQMQNLLNSQSFPRQTPHTPFLEQPIEEESEPEKCLEVFCDRMQNMLDSLSQPNFQESYSLFQSHLFKMNKLQYWIWVWNPCVSPSSNRKIRWTHNFTIIFKIDFHTHIFKKNQFPRVWKTWFQIQILLPSQSVG